MIRRYDHGRAWPGEDAPPDTPLWRWWVASLIGCWAAVGLLAVAVLYVLPWIADKVLL